MHIYRRGKVYYYRIKIPKPLINYFKKQEIHKSLKTINKLIAYKYAKILQTHFEFIKQGILMNKLTSSQLHSAISNFISLKFEETENELYNHPNPQKTLSWQKGDWHHGVTDLKEQLLHNKYHPDIVEQAKEIIDKLTNNYSNKELIEVCRHIVQGNIQLMHIFIAKIENNTYMNDKNPYAEDFITSVLNTKQINMVARVEIQQPREYQEQIFIPIKQESINTEKVVTLTEAFDKYYERYISIRKRSIDTKDKLQNVKHLFELNFGLNMNIKEITDDDLVAFRNKLLKLPNRYSIRSQTKKLTSLDDLVRVGKEENILSISKNTVNMHLGYMSSFWEYCLLTKCFIDINPHQDLAVPIDKTEKKRTAYSTFELDRLFKTKLYTKNINAELKATPEHIFIPLLGLYQGTRLNELCQLYKEDIKQIDGIWSIDINREKDKSIKNDNSIRVIPIHPKIIEAGFIDYVKSVKTDRLWPNFIKTNKFDGDFNEDLEDFDNVKGTYSNEFSKWYRTKVNRAHVSNDSDKVYHSFRHNLIHAFRDKDIGGEHPPALLGHLEKHEMTYVGYGKKILVKYLIKSLEKVEYNIDSLDKAIVNINKAVKKIF